MKPRNCSIDALKFLCAFLIVVLHTHGVYDYIRPFTRCAVPCFFMISGYLLYSDNGIGKMRLKRNIRHILDITVWATLLFAIQKEIISLCHDVELYVPSLRQIAKFVILNENPFGYHLWYLGAYMYALIIIYFVDKYNKWKWLFYSIPLLLFVDLAFGKYSLLLFDKEFDFTLVRNFLFVGIPYFGLGAWLKSNGDSTRHINKYLLSGGG